MPAALVPAVTRTLHEISADQAVERPATLEDVRTQVLTPQRLNAFVFSAFGGIALLIAVVGVAGVLAFSVGARTREFGIRLAVGCEPRRLRASVLREGAAIAATGIVAGGLGGVALTWAASRLFGVAQLPGVLPIAGAAGLLAARGGPRVALARGPARRAWTSSRRCDRSRTGRVLRSRSPAEPERRVRTDLTLNWTGALTPRADPS
jgi:hypothetical protein